MYYFLYLFLISSKISSLQSKIIECIDTELLDVNNNTVSKDNCESRPCIISTCPYGKFNYPGVCSSIKDSLLDFSKFLKLYKIVAGVPVETEKILDNDMFQVVTLKDPAAHLNATCLTQFYSVGKDINGYFLQNGSFLFIKDDSSLMVIPAGEYIVRFSENHAGEPELRVKYAKKTAKREKLVAQPKTSNLMEELFAYVMLLSCFFMILVVVVYVVCKELRTTAGLTLMTYVTNMAVTFLLTAIRSLGILHRLLDDKTCFVLSALQHFFLFSSFTWMDIMGFDIWWTLRKLVVNRPIIQAANYSKFAAYCCIAWIPWVLYVALEVCLEEFTATYGPRFKMCTARANQWYWAGPILALQLLNLIPLVLTIVNLWRFKKSLKQLSNADSFSTSPKQNAFLSVKISIAIGTNWFLDVMILLFDDALSDWFKNAAKIFNALNGVILFFVFVFKTDVLLKFFRRLSINNGITQYLEQRISRQFESDKSRKWSQYSSSNATVTQMVYSEPDADERLSESE